MKKIEVRKKDIELDGAYEGWKLTVRANAKFKVIGDLSSGEYDRITESLAHVILDWNFLDEDGIPLEDITPEAIGELPYDLIKILVGAVTKAVTEVDPN